MATQRVVKSILTWETNAQSLQKLIVDNNKAGDAVVQQAKRAADATNSARQSTEAYNSVLGQMSATTSAKLTLLEQKMRDGARSTEALRQSAVNASSGYDQLARAELAASDDKFLNNLRAEAVQLDENTRKMQGYSNSISGKQQAASTGINTGQVAGRIAGLGAIVGGGAGGQVFPAAAQIIQLTSTFGVAGAAAGVFALALRALGEETKRQADLTTARLNAEKETARFIADATRQSLVATRQAAIDELAQLQADIERNGNQRITINPDSLLGLLTGGLVGGGQAEAIKQAQDATQAAITATNTKIEDYTQAINENATAAADARVAEELLAQQRKEFTSYVYGITKVQTDADLRQFNLRVQIDNMTAAQREERRAQEEAELALVNSRLRQGNLTIEAEAKLRDRQGELIESITFLTEITDTYADRLFREQAAKALITQRADEYLAALQKEGEARDALAKAQQAEADAALTHALNVLALQETAREKETELWRKAGDEAVEAQGKANADRIKQDLSYYKQVQDIQRRANAAITNAVMARDAAAAYFALQAKAEDLRKAKEDNDERTDQINKALEEQQRTIAKRLDEQLRAQRKAADDALRTENTRYQKEAALLAQATAKAQQALTTAQATSNAILQSYYAQALIYTRNFVNSASAEYARLVTRAAGSSGGGGGSGGSSTGGSLPINPYGGQVYTDSTGKVWVWNGRAWQPGTAVRQFHSGTPYVPQDGIYELQKGEAVVSERENRGGGVNFTFINNGSNMTPAQVEQTALNVYGRIRDRRTRGA